MTHPMSLQSLKLDVTDKEGEDDSNYRWIEMWSNISLPTTSLQLFLLPPIQGMPNLGQNNRPILIWSDSDWPQMGKIWDFKDQFQYILEPTLPYLVRCVPERGSIAAKCLITPGGATDQQPLAIAVRSPRSRQPRNYLAEAVLLQS